MTGNREASKACPPGCCSRTEGQDISFLVPLADALAPQNSHKRGTTAEANGRNVSQRSVRFSLDLQELGRSPAAANNNSAIPAASCLKNSGAQPVRKYTLASALETAPSAESDFSMASVPLGPVEMDYSFTERGALPEELEASGLAAAFGPEPCADEAPEPRGVSARIQVGDALVSLLEHHHKHRYAVATADPNEVVANKGCISSSGGNEPVELDRRARSLTRSLARSAASSPLVQLLAQHRKSRENLTGWQDESHLPNQITTSSPAPLPFPAPSMHNLPPKLALQPAASTALLGHELSAFMPGSSAGSACGSSAASVRSAHSASQSNSSGSSSVCGSALRCGSDASSASATMPVLEGPALQPSQCPGCGSMTNCCCKDHDLASHASLESGMETGVDVAMAPAGISHQGSAASSLRNLLPDAPNFQSNAIRRMLAAQLPKQGTSSSVQAGGLVSGGTTPQKLIVASRNASFNEVLSRCLGSLGSESGSSPLSKPAAVDEQTAAPFIPINTSSLGDMELRQALKGGKSSSRWSFDSAMLPQYMHGRPGIVERRSVDGASVASASSSEPQPSYTSLMAAYRERLGMSSSSSSASLAKVGEAPTLTDALSGALKQALRSQLSTSAGSRRASEDTSSAASAATQQQAFPPLPAPTSNRNSSEQQQPQQQHQPGCYAQVALTSQLFGPSPFQGAPALQPINVPVRRLSAERKNSGSWLPTVDESPPSQPSAESPIALAPHDAAAAAKSSLFRALNEQRGALLARHSIGSAPNSCGGRPPISPRRRSMCEESWAFPGGGNAAAPFEALGLPPAGEASSPRRLSCARARSKAQSQQGAASVAQARRVAAAVTATQKPAQEAARQLPDSQASTASVPAARDPAATSGIAGNKKCSQAPQDTSGVLAAVAEQLAAERERAKRLAEVTPSDLALHPPSLRPLRILSPEPQRPAASRDALVAVNSRELSLEHFVHSNSRRDGTGNSNAGAGAKLEKGARPDEERKQLPRSCSAAVAAAPNCAAPSGQAGPAAAAAKGAAARALFSMNKSANAASRAVVRSFGRSNSLRGEEAGAVQPPTASAPSVLAAQLGPAANVPSGAGLTDTFKELSISLRRPGETEAQRRSITFSPGTPPVRTEPMPFSPERRPPSPPPTSPEEGYSSSKGIYSLPGIAAGFPSKESFSNHPVLVSSSAAVSVASVLAPASGVQHPVFGSLGHSESHELSETYGAHRVRAETVRAEALRAGSGAKTRLGLGLMPPSAMWVEHRAGAHVTPVLHHRGHFSMDDIRRPRDAFSPSTGLLPFPHPVFEGTAESMEKQRRDSYLARTLSNLARAKLDHAVALAAEKDGPPEKWEMRFADDGPDATFGHTLGSKEGAISRAKRMMAEAAAAHPSHAYFTDGNIARRDADGITALLDVLATPKTAAEMQERALSTLAFLVTSPANTKIIVAANGVAVLVPLLGARSDGVVTVASGILRRLLPLPSGQAAFVEENGLAILTSLLSASKSPRVLLDALDTMMVLAEASEASDADGSAEGAALIARCGAVPAAVRLACPTAYGGDASVSAAGARSGEGVGARSGAAAHVVDPVPLAALALLLKLANRPELRAPLRSANLMSALASMMVPGAPEALLTPAIQLTAMLASDMAAAAEFAARGGVIGLMALVSDGGDKEGVIAVQAAAVLGCLVQCSRARSAVWAAGGGSVLLPALHEASPLALSGVLYLLSCLAEFKDLRAELESADAVPMLLDLLATCTDTQIQAATVSLLRIFTRAGETLCPILEHQPTSFSEDGLQVHNRPVQMERRSFDSCQKKQADRKPDLAAPGRSQSLSLF
ncbi:hypothetical protein COCOBI_15-0580 [Coccomyxa sp. Obi]|nr:hypothetical protein COCOBI_15-0580 [Coccomyxa sp. Obi]